LSGDKNGQKSEIQDIPSRVNPRTSRVPWIFPRTNTGMGTTVRDKSTEALQMPSFTHIGVSRLTGPESLIERHGVWLAANQGCYVNTRSSHVDCKMIRVLGVIGTRMRGQCPEGKNRRIQSLSRLSRDIGSRKKFFLSEPRDDTPLSDPLYHFLQWPSDFQSEMEASAESSVF
jgi:hypothetical protein